MSYFLLGLGLLDAFVFGVRSVSFPLGGLLARVRRESLRFCLLDTLVRIPAPGLLRFLDLADCTAGSTSVFMFSFAVIEEAKI